MKTIAEALQYNTKQERKILIKFILLSFLLSTVAVLTLFFADVPKKELLCWIAPLVLVAVLAKYTGATVFFTKRKVEGEVIKINIYPIRAGKVKGVHTYESSRGDGLEAEIIIKTDNGDTVLRVFPNGDTTTRLCIGDRVAFFRCIGQPVVIRGQYLK
ncbi:MAG: hypothetical protein IKU23_02680 [Clostridia bacterium]|nr:hypothetical protein [Clostridia bacterium]